MSHTSTVSAIKITSISALRAAVAELATNGVGIMLKENAVPRAYFTNQNGMGKAEYVLELAQSKYDIGLYKGADGSYEARTDFFGNQIANVLGAPASCAATRDQAQMGKLFQMYGIHAAIEAARKQGHMVNRVNRQDGTVALEITGAGL